MSRKRFAVATIKLTKKIVFEVPDSEDIDSDISALELYGQDLVNVEIYPDIDLVELGDRVWSSVNLQYVSEDKALRVLEE